MKQVTISRRAAAVNWARQQRGIVLREFNQSLKEFDFQNAEACLERLEIADKLLADAVKMTND